MRLGHQLGAQRFQQAFASVLALVEHPLETFIAPKIRIDDNAAVIARGEFHEQTDLVAVFRWAEFCERGSVGIVHCNQEVEPREICFADLPATQQGQVITTGSGRALGAFIRRLADMPITRARRIDDDPVRESCLPHLMKHHRFGAGRTANVAKGTQSRWRSCSSGSGYR